jgi:elongation factor P--(R)-beta-lysine ligase
MQEVDALLIETLGTDASEMVSYQDVFQSRLGIDLLTATDDMLLAKMADCNINISSPEQLDKDSKLQLLFAMAIEPAIGQERPCFVFGFPASQASLARINTEDSRTADRFEVYFKGAELANGFHELSDASEQEQRFEQDNEKRRNNGQSVKPIDTRFLSALKSGLPHCAGVALGIDRLLMLKIGASHIKEVLNFPVSRA